MHRTAVGASGSLDPTRAMLCDVLEYLIKADDGDFLLPHVNELAATVQPAGRQCEAIDGPGDYRMRCAEVVVALSFEELAIHVVVESEDADAADRLVGEIAAQVASSMARSTFVVPL